MVYIQKDGATLLVGACQREKQQIRAKANSLVFTSFLGLCSHFNCEYDVDD